MPPDQITVSPIHCGRERSARRGHGVETVPSVRIGGYIRTPYHGSIRCRAYDGPPDVHGGGTYCWTYPPGTRIGPIQKILMSSRFQTVEVENNVWINIWNGDRGANGVWYASPCD